MEEGGNVRKKVMSIIISAVMVVSISASMAKNVGEPSSSGAMGLPLSNISVPIPQIVGQPSSSLGGSGGLANSPWPMFQRTPDHKGYVASDGPTLCPLLWKKNLDIIFTSPVIADGKVYVNGFLNSTDTFYCLDAENGEILWEFIVPSGVATTTPSVANGKVFVGTFWGVGMFYCLDANTGAVLWEKDVGTMYTQGAIVIEDVAYIPTNSRIYALNANNGTEIWSTYGGKMHAGAAVYGNEIYIYKSGLTALNRFDGSQIWSYPCGHLYTTPTVAYGKVFIQTPDGYLHAIYKDNGSLAWKYDLNTSNWNAIQSSCGAGYNRIFVGAQVGGAANDSMGKFFCFDPYNGTLIWSVETNGSIISSPAISGNGIVYVGAKNLLALNVTDGSILWTFDPEHIPSCHSPALYNGLVYTASWTTVFAIGTSGPDLKVNVTSHFTSLNSAAQSLITVHNTDGINPVQGATVNLVSDNGGIFSPQSGITDTNGDFKSIFNAPTVTTQIICRISAQASKIGYNNGSGYVDVTINPIPWPMFRQNLRHTGLSPYDTRSNNGQLKWIFGTGDCVQSSPVIGSDGTIYIGSEDKKLYAIKPDGTQKWSYTTGERIRWSSPAIGSDGTIYVGSDDYKLYAINPDGTEKWNFATGRYIKSSPVIGSDGTIYIGSYDYKLYAINPDGTEKWSFITRGSVGSSPAIGSDGTIYVGSHAGKLYAIDPDGTEKWSFTTVGGGVYSSPAIGPDGTIYIDSHDNKLYAINPDGSEKWNFTSRFSWSSPAIGSDGTIYVGSKDAILYAIDPDGTEKWSFMTGEGVYSSPAIGSDGTIYVGSEDKKLHAINSDGTEKWNFATGHYIRSSPAVGSDGTIYVGSNDGKLYALGNPSLKVNVTSHFSSLNSAAQSLITVHITDGTNPVQGATVNLDSDNGGKFSPQSGITDANGDLKSIFNAPIVTSQVICRISAEASKTGYNNGSGYVDVTINPIPWPMFRHNHHHTGQSPYDTSSNNGKLKWSFTTGYWIDSSPAIGSDGTIYFGSMDNKLYAINPDGSEKWSFKTGHTVYSSPAIDSDGTIYFGSMDNKLYAINPDGSEKWRFTTGWYIGSSPAIGSDGTIYVGSQDHCLYAINSDGTEKWNYTTGNDIHSSPAIDSDGTIYVGSWDNRFYAINPDGTKKWDFTTGNIISSSPVVGSDGTIYIGSTDHKLYAINPDGSEKWNFTTGYAVYSSPAISSDDTIYVGSDDNKLYAINMDGSEKWNFTTGSYILSSPAVGSDGSIFVGSCDNRLYAINPDGSEKWNFMTEYHVHSSPTIGSDGTIYVGSWDNKLYAIGEGGTPPIANAGPDQTVNEGDVVHFNGTGSEGSGAYDYWDSFLFGADSFITSAPSDTILATFDYYGTVYPALVATDYGNGRAVYTEGSTFSQLANLVDPGNVHHQLFLNSVKWSTKGKDPATSNILVVWGHRELLTYGTSAPGVEDSNATRALEDKGYNVSTSHDVPASLAGYDAVIIPGIGWSWGGWVNPNLWSGPGGTNTAHKPTAAEVTTLLSFIQNGGGLVASVEYEYGADWLQDVGNPMGVYFDAITWETPYTAYRIVEHPIFLKWDGEATEIISYEWDFESDGIYDYQETSAFAPDGAFDGKTTHVYGDDGNYTVTLRVTDNNNLSATDTCNITVQNVDPKVTIDSITMDVEIGLRVAGRKYNNVSMTLSENEKIVGHVSIERMPGSPNEQVAWIPVSINFSRSYSAIVTYIPKDPPNIGGNPVWIYLKSKNGSINKIHHTFNVQQSKKRDSEHWNHVEPWEVDLNEHFIGLPFNITSHITDPGSDDENLIFTYGYQVGTITYLNNPPNPDPYPSPEVRPVDIKDTTTLVYEGPGIVTLVVRDDDNIRLGIGQGSDSFDVS